MVALLLFHRVFQVHPIVSNLEYEQDYDVRAIQGRKFPMTLCHMVNMLGTLAVIILVLLYILYHKEISEYTTYIANFLTQALNL